MARWTTTWPLKGSRNTATLEAEAAGSAWPGSPRRGAPAPLFQRVVARVVEPNVEYFH